MDRLNVRRTTDLTRYHPDLVQGAEGVTVGQSGLWSRASDRFVGVSFPRAGVFDILWDSLEIIDEAYLQRAAQRAAELRESLKGANNVVCARGPRGGFRYLSYEYVAADGARRHCTTSFRSEANELMEVFRQYGIPIREEIIG
jgi:hypothetical protein